MAQNHGSKFSTRLWNGIRKSIVDIYKLSKLFFIEMSEGTNSESSLKISLCGLIVIVIE